MHLRLEYAVDKAVSLCYLSAPTVLGLSFQGFGMPCTCSWMFYKFVQEFYGKLEQAERSIAEGKGHTFTHPDDMNAWLNAM